MLSLNLLCDSVIHRYDILWQTQTDANLRCEKK